MSTDDFGTVLAPVVTPFADGDVDAEALADLVAFQREAGVEGFVPCGTTGEFASLDDEEYATVVETTVEAAGDAPVLAGTANPSVAGTVSRIEAAAACGADAALVVLPYFHAANDPAGNEQFLREVLDAASLPVVLYNIPACVGQEIDPSTLEAVADHPDAVGMKDSSGDMTYFVECLRRTPDDFALYQGFDSQLVPGVGMGATGGINALANVIPEAFAAALDAVAAGETGRAREIQTDHIAPLFQACVAHGFAPATKTALVARGVLSDAAVRPPLVELDDDAVADIEACVQNTVSAFE
ncbi:dihydrodipicolinate synthase family protein [Salinirarus marinus]|uniref:dihydrodipicolinate synthase family protein n=1 Tax=Salinirarus marinus TaxID=3068310 RepID=UPI003C6CBE20